MKNGWDGYLGNKKCASVEYGFTEKRNSIRIRLVRDGVTIDVTETVDIMREVYQSLEDQNYDIELLEDEDFERLQTKLIYDNNPDITYYIKLMKVCINVRKAKLNDKPVMKCDEPVKYEKKDEPIKYEKKCTRVIKCENACSSEESCICVDTYFQCDHYQCLLSMYEIGYCIVCGCDDMRY